MIHFGGIWTYVADDAVFVWQKRCIWRKKTFFSFLPLRKNYIFKAFLFVTSQQKALKVTKYAEKTSVFVLFCFFKGERRAREWTAGLLFWYLCLSLKICHRLCDEDNRQFHSWEMIQSLIHPVSHFRSARAAWFVQNNHRRKQQF